MSGMRARSLLNLPSRAEAVLSVAQRSVDEMRVQLSALLRPLTVLLWLCVLAVACETAFGSHRHAAGIDPGTGTIAQRTVSGAVDQMWYALFYLLFPIAARMVHDKVSSRAEWTIVNSPVRCSAPSVARTHRITKPIAEDWVVVDWSWRAGHDETFGCA